MILKAKTKLEFGQKRSSIFPVRSFALFFVFSFFSYASFSQQSAFKFNKTSLSDALLEVSKTLHLQIAFDSKAMAGYKLSGTYDGTNPDALLGVLLQKTGYKVEKKYNSYLIIPENQNSPTRIMPLCQVSGIVTDLISGEQLPYASIFLPEQDIYLASTVSGTFSFQVPASDFLRIRIQYLGYQSIDTLISATNQQAVLIFKMKQKDTRLATISIKKARMKMIDQSNDASHSTVNPVGFVNLPNMGEFDIFRTIQLLPGVAYSENSSGLHIRGGTADQNLVLFDGFTLYNLDHFFGAFSSVNPNVVKDIQIFKGGFDSHYGERLSGIIDITGKSGDKFTPRVNGGLNMVSGNVTAEMPLSKRTTLLIAGRRSYADIYSSYLVDDLLENQASEKIAPDKDQSIVQLKPGYYFYDYNAKLSFFKSDQEKMSVSFFGAKDFLSSAGEGNNKQTYAKTTDEANWGNYGFSVSWIKQWKEKLFSNFQIGYSGYQNEYDNLTVVNSFWKSASDQINQFSSYDENKLNDFSLSLKNSYSINLKNLIDFGVQTKFNEVTYQKNAGKEAYYADIANSSWLSSSFIQLRTQAISDLSLKFGGRISLYNHSSRLYFEPRFSGNYRLTDRFSLKFATGKYFQFLSKVTPTQSYGYNRDFWMISDDDKHPILSSDHYIVGSTFTYKNFSFDLETYYKTINGLQLFLYIPPFQKNVDSGSFPPQGQSKKTQLPGKFINGEGSSIGLDLLLKYESNNFTSWISYSRSKSIRNFKEINGNENIPASYDRAHEFKLTNLITLGKWNLSGMWIYSTGQPYVVEQKVDKTLVATFKYDRLPDYTRFDVAANYNFNVRRVKMKVGISVINLFNTNNFNDIYSRDFNFDSTSFNETSYVRSLGMTPNFFINFQY